MPPADPNALGLSLPLWSVLPFAALLLSIALFPVFAPGFWVRHFGKVSLAYGLPVAAYFLASAPRELLHLAMEYVSFIVLLAALFIVSGGILIRGTVRATPGLNCAILAIGALLSNALGTTGASMVLIRPLLRANAGRKRIAHVVIFFIFVVANIGGSLSAIGDPPLFLGYLKGVPFFWTLVHVGPMWVLVCAAVIGVFYLFDRRAFAIDQLAGPAAGSGGTTSADTGVCAVAGRARVSVEGKINLPLLGAVIAAVFLPTPWRETVMVAAAGVSVWLTPAGVREENEFTYHPIEEVAILFAGIFATMLPAMLILKARGGELGVTDPAHFFWATGVLSSFLDNAPTYLTFFSMALGQLGMTEAMVPGACAVGAVTHNQEFVALLKGISAGSVFMGANTYIGNAPNFMVKSIAEEAGIAMPSFFGYMFKYSIPILIPVFVIVTLVFF